MIWGLNTHPLGRSPSVHAVVCDFGDDAECAVCIPSRPARDTAVRWVSSRDEATDIVLTESDEPEALTIQALGCNAFSKACETASPKDAHYALYISDGIAFARIWPGRPDQTFTVQALINGALDTREVRIQ